MVVSLLAAISVGLTPAHAQLSKGERDTVMLTAVEPTESTIKSAKLKKREIELTRFKELLKAEILSSLNSMNVFKIVERSRLSELQEEQALAAVAGDPTQNKAAQMMQLSAAKFNLMVDIEMFEIKTSVQNFEAIARTSSTREVMCSVSMRIVDTSTSELLPFSPSVQLSESNSVSLAMEGTRAGSDSAYTSLAKRIAKALIEQTVSKMRPPKVLVVTGTQAMINRGSRAGFTQGQAIEFFAVQDIVDEDSGTTYLNEVPVGKGKVTRCDEDKAYVEILGENLGVAKGCIARAHLDPQLNKKGKPSTKSKEAPVSPGSAEAPINF